MLRMVEPSFVVNGSCAATFRIVMPPAKRAVAMEGSALVFTDTSRLPANRPSHAASSWVSHCLRRDSRRVRASAADGYQRAYPDSSSHCPSDAKAGAAHSRSYAHADSYSDARADALRSTKN